MQDKITGRRILPSLLTSEANAWTQKLEVHEGRTVTHSRVVGRMGAPIVKDARLPTIVAGFVRNLAAAMKHDLEAKAIMYL